MIHRMIVLSNDEEYELPYFIIRHDRPVTGDYLSQFEYDIKTAGHDGHKSPYSSDRNVCYHFALGYKILLMASLPNAAEDAPMTTESTLRPMTGGICALYSA